MLDGAGIEVLEVTDGIASVRLSVCVLAALQPS